MPPSCVHVHLDESDAGYSWANGRGPAGGPARRPAVLPSRPACRRPGTYPGTSAAGQADRLRGLRSRLVSFRSEIRTHNLPVEPVSFRLRLRRGAKREKMGFFTCTEGGKVRVVFVSALEIVI